MTSNEFLNENGLAVNIGYKKTSDVMDHIQDLRGKLVLMDRSQSVQDKLNYIKNVATEILAIAKKKDFVNNRPTSDYSELSNTLDGYFEYAVPDYVMLATIKKYLKK